MHACSLLSLHGSLSRAAPPPSPAAHLPASSHLQPTVPPVCPTDLLSAQGNWYYAFGGCHRWAAHTRLGSPTIPAKLIKVSPATINTYLGASSPFRSLPGLTGAAGASADQQQQPSAVDGAAGPTA